MSSSILASGQSWPMHLSYGIAALRGRWPALTDDVADAPSFTLMSPTMGMDYFAVVDGFFGAYSAQHMAERLHVAIAKGIEDELVAESPRFLECPDDVEGWWWKIVLDAVRVVDDELVAMIHGVAVGSPAVVALVLKDYIVLAKRGATCRAVIYRGEEAVLLTSDSELRREPYRPKEQQNLQDAGGHLVGSTCKLEDNKAISPAMLFKPYFPKPEVLIVDRKPQDKFLILATPGVWDHITPAEACVFIQKRMLTASPTIIATELAALALRKGSWRNVTVGIIMF